jgi:hypothetical protein
MLEHPEMIHDLRVFSIQRYTRMPPRRPWDIARQTPDVLSVPVRKIVLKQGDGCAPDENAVLSQTKRIMSEPCIESVWGHVDPFW